MIARARRGRSLRGAAILEFSLALPIFILVTLGLAILGLGVSQFQMVATLAREGARYASVRGTEYQQVTGNAAATAADVYNNAILPKATGLAPGELSYGVTWSPNNQPGSQVAVTVNYQYVPCAYLGTINMTSTSKMTISY